MKKLRHTVTNAPDMVSELQKFFGVGSLEYIKNQSLSHSCFNVAFRKYQRETYNINTSLAWLRLGVLKAQNTDIPKFNKSKLKEMLEEIAQISCGNYKTYMQKLEKALNNCGVVLACMPYLKNTHIQGCYSVERQ